MIWVQIVLTLLFTIPVFGMIDSQKSETWPTESEEIDMPRPLYMKKDDSCCHNCSMESRFILRTIKIFCIDCLKGCINCIRDDDSGCNQTIKKCLDYGESDD